MKYKFGGVEKKLRIGGYLGLLQRLRGALPEIVSI